MLAEILLFRASTGEGLPTLAKSLPALANLRQQRRKLCHHWRRLANKGKLPSIGEWWPALVKASPAQAMVRQ
ncbi:hypothetical protein R1flu_017648 [Riccia fluitans]|uniref:Uncharacterized protein n=1 Tax=Riccia fluitans TaxID=41844 RepID=A0ABD1ZEV6_9MARC